MSYIKVEEEYILIPLVTRVSLSLFVFFLNFYIISGLIDTYIGLWVIDIPMTRVGVSVGVVTGIIVGFLTFLFLIWINRFLVWLCKRWSLKQFLQLEGIIKKFTIIILMEAVVFALYENFVSPLPQWISILYLLQALVLFDTFSLSGLFTRRGKAILCLEQFTNDYKRDPSKADFRYLQLGSQNIARWLRKKYQIQVSPSSLAFGMTTASLENRNRKRLNKIITGLKNPRDSKSFANFRSSVESFLAMAEESRKKGISEKSHFLTYVRFMEVARYIVIPILVAFIALTPEIMKTLKG